MAMNSKSKVQDPIPTWMLKECFDILGPVLLKIVNMSLCEGKFPDVLKHASVCPTIENRSGNEEELKNYCPISNTTFLAKVLEKAVFSQINVHINGNDLHSVFQSGYI